MRIIGPVLATLLLAVAAFALPPGELRIDSISWPGDTTRLRASFDVPPSAADRDLREALIVLTLGAEPPIALDPGTTRLRIDRTGTKLSFRAKDRKNARLVRLRLSMTAGECMLTLGGTMLDVASLPAISLDIGRRSYLFVPPTGGGPGPTPDPTPGPSPAPAPAPLPEGPVASTLVDRRATQETVPVVTSAVLRSAADVTAFTGRLWFGGGAPPAAFSQVDFGREMIVVAVGEETLDGQLPFSVTITKVEMIQGRLTVAFDQHWGPQIPVDSASTAAVHYHAVRVPRTTAPVDFVATKVKTQTPYM